MPTAIHPSAHYFPVGTQFLFFALVVVLLCACKCAAMTSGELQQAVNETVTRCLMLAQITMQEAAHFCGMSEVNFRRSLSGEEYRNISLVALCHLPYRFWLHFAPDLVWLVAKRNTIATLQSAGQMVDDVMNLRRRA